MDIHDWYLRLEKQFRQQSGKAPERDPGPPPIYIPPPNYRARELGRRRYDAPKPMTLTDDDIQFLKMVKVRWN